MPTHAEKRIMPYPPEQVYALVADVDDPEQLAAAILTVERRLGTVGSVIRYGADLELFVEKRFGDKVSLRLSAANLLDASKDEFFHKFDNLDDQLDRKYDEYELETEDAGPSYQLVMRWAF